MRTMLAVVMLSLLLAACAGPGSGTAPATAADGGLWPPIEPFETGWLRVSDLHEIYDEEIEREIAKFDTCTFAAFENHYMARGCFLEEGRLLERADRLAGIPTWIVNGRYDVICPATNAWNLHRRIPGSHLILVDGAGHWMGEPGIERELVRIFEEL